MLLKKIKKEENMKDYKEELLKKFNYNEELASLAILNFETKG